MYKEQLEGFPKEVVDLMLERQFEQNGRRDVTVFETYKNAGAASGGFSWIKTEEGYGFWKEVIRNRNFDVFFEMYPKKESEHVPPDYYAFGGVEPIDLIEAKELNFNLGNVIKYVARSGKKSPDQLTDLRKALDYLQREISRLENRK